VEAARILNEEVLMADEKKTETPEPQGADASVVKEPFTVKHPKVDKEIVAPDGHVVLSQEDLDARTG